jgi:hypothetical protein
MTEGWGLLLPWRAARRVFGSPTVDGSPTHWLSWARSVVGLATVLAISLPHRSSAEMVLELGEHAVLVTAGAFAVFLLVAPVVYALAERDTRRLMRRGLPAVGVCLLVVVATVGVFVLVVYYRIGDDLPGPMALWVVLGIWCAVFAVFGVVHGARSVLRIGDVHPLLAPVCAVAGSTALCVVEVVGAGTGGLPADQWVLLNVGGAALTAVVAGLELWLLHIDGTRLLRPAEPFALAYEQKRRRRRIAFGAVAPLLALGAVGAVVLIHQALGGGDWVVGGLMVATVLFGRALWRRGGDRVRELLR